MKRIVRNLMFGLLLCVGFTAVSCSNDPDAPMDEIPYERVLTPLNFEAEVVASKGTDITFSWSSMENADGYILQLFEAVDEDGLEIPDYDNSLPYAEYEVATEDVPFTVTNLEVDKTFWARLRATSNTIGDSKWAELNESVSTSAVRNSLEPFVVERTEGAITIGWADAEDKMDLTSVRVESVEGKEGIEPKLVALTADQKSAASATFAELAPATNYKFTLLFGKSGQRGVVTAWTRPSTEGFNTVNSVEAIYNAINGTVGDVKLRVEYNEAGYDMATVITADLAAGITVGCNLYMVGVPTEDGKKPVISNFGLALAEGVTSLHLEDLVLDGGNTLGTAVQNDKAVLTSMEMVNCELTGYTKAIYSSSSSATSSVEKALFSGVYAHDINATGANGGDFIDIRAGENGDIEIVNSTFYAVARTFLRVSDKAKLNSASITNCTFNYVTSTLSSSNNAGIFHIRQTTEATALTMTKNVFLNEYNDNENPDDVSKCWVRIARNSTDSYAPLCDGNIYYNVGAAWFVSAAVIPQSGETFSESAAMTNAIVLVDDPCVNSEAGKLYLTDGIIAANKAGDPRWWDATEPIVIRPTELEVVSEPKVWDFTDKTIFQSESVETNTIIDNIKIYGPAEIVMNEGISFAEAGVMGTRPESSALHFKAEGYGAVVVKTLDSGYNASVQVVVGEDRYTVQADGVDHKVLLGDLVGVNDIYVLAGSAVTVTGIEWTQDLTPDATAEALKTPVVSFDTSSVDEGTELAVTASWAAVENAATYSVTFRGVTTEQTETSLLLDAATVAAMPVGEYEISVVAKPVETSSKYLASEAGVATFKVKKIVVGGEVTLTWDFSSSAWTPLITEIAALGSTGSTDLDVTIDGLNVVAGGKNIRASVASDSKPAFFQPNGGGSTTQRVFKFEAPASGTLAVKVSGTGSSEDLSRLVNVKVGDAEPMQNAGGYVDPTIIIFDVEVSAPTTVYVYPSAGLRFYSLEYTYVAAATPEPLFWGAEDFDALWNNAFAGNTGNIDAAALATATQISGMTLNADGWTYNDLEFILGGGKFKFGQNNNSEGVKATRVQFGGSGNKGKQALVFEAPAAGTLYVEVVSSGDAARTIGVQIDDNAVMEQATPDKTQPAAILEFDCSDAVAGSKIYIFSTNSGNNLFSIKYEM